MTHYFEYLERQIRTFWNKPLLSDYKASAFTGREIAKNIFALQFLFRKAGMSKGDKVAIYGSNSARWGMAFLSANTAGAVAVPLLSDFRPGDAARLVSHSEAVILFVQNSNWASMDIADMPALRLVVSLDDFTILHSSEGMVKIQAPEVRPDDVHFQAIPGDTLAVINYTSGTTSAPKGVMLTFDNFNTNVRFALDHIPPKHGDQIVSMLPLAHMYGFMFEFLYPVCGGVHVHFLGKTPTPAVLLQAFKDVRPYILITVPLVLEKIFRSSVQPVVSKPSMKILMAIPGISRIIGGKIRDKMMEAFGGNIRQIIMGGAALNPDVEKWLRKIRLPYTVGYGMTEAAPLLAYEWWEQFAPGSCGKAADRCEVRIDSEDPQHIAGEIQARGANIMKGYFKNEEATAQAFTEDGWLRTGDLGVIDAKGNIFIRGRSKNMILSSNGQNIYPEEIEAVINSMPDVQESVVVARGAALTALVYAGADGCTISEDIIRKINSRLPSYSRISHVEQVPSPFEKTPKQSIKRFLYK